MVMQNIKVKVVWFKSYEETDGQKDTTDCITFPGKNAL